MDQFGSEGTFYVQSGNTAPISGSPVPVPPDGSNAAMSDALGPGAHVLYQDFTPVAAQAGVFLAFDLFVGNLAGDFYVHDTLDFATPALNQQARVDLLAAGADPFSVAPSDILFNAFATPEGFSAAPGYVHYSFDISAILNANLNQPLRLRFAETDNVFTFNLGVDNVSIAAAVAAVPETLPAWPAALLIVGFACLQHRSRHRASAK